MLLMKPTKMYLQSSAKGDEHDSTNFFFFLVFPFSFYCFLGRNFLNLGFRVGTSSVSQHVDMELGWGGGSTAMGAGFLK